MSTHRKQETEKHTDLVLEVAPPEVGHLKKISEPPLKILTRKFQGKVFEI